MSTLTAPTRQHVRVQLEQLIAEMRVGARLPGERELSERWQVARMTLRGAVDALVTEGLLERRHGSGTFIVPRPLVRALGLTSFSQDMRERGLVPGSRLLAFGTHPVDAGLAAQLDLPLSEPIYHFTRLRLGSGEAMAVETTWIPVRYVPGLSETDLDASLYEVLASRYRITTGSARVSIEPVLPDAKVRAQLGISADQACLRLHMVDSDTRGRVIMVANCVYRGDKYQLFADVSGAAFTKSRSYR